MTKLDDILRRLQEAKGDRDETALATLDFVLDTYEPALRAAVEACAVPHWFDASILAELLELEEPEAAEQTAALARLPFVEPFEARRAHNVHEATRLAIRSRLVRDDPERLNHLSTRATRCFSGEGTHLRVERVYHHLRADPTGGATELEGLWKDWGGAGRHEALQALAVALEELIERNVIVLQARARALITLVWIRGGAIARGHAAQMAREALLLFEPAGDPRGLMDAHDALGDVLRDQGLLAEALKEFEAHKAICIEVSKRDPEDTDWLSDLSISHNKIGGVFRAQGKLAEALQEYEASKAICIEISERDLENTRWLRYLSVSHNEVAVVFEAQGKLVEALQEFEAYKAISLELSERDPENTRWLKDLSVCHNNIGSVFQAQGKLAEALREFEATKAICLELSERDPENTDWLRGLSVSYSHVGGVFDTQGKLAEALREFEAYKAISLELTERDPENTGWLRDLSVSHNKVGGVFQAQGKLAEALQEFESDLAIAEQLADLDPSNATWREDLKVARRCVAQARDKLSPE